MRSKLITNVKLLTLITAKCNNRFHDQALAREENSLERCNVGLQVYFVAASIIDRDQQCGNRQYIPGTDSESFITLISEVNMVNIH